jgi:hypothetical protein
VLTGIYADPNYERFSNLAQAISSGLLSHPQQPTDDILALYRSSVIAKDKYGSLMKQVATITRSVWIEAQIKGMYRVLEKAIFVKDPSTRLKVHNICDVVRGALEFTDMNAMLTALELLVAASSNVHTSAQGWAKAAKSLPKVTKLHLRCLYEQA